MVASLCMWNRSIVLRCGPFLWKCMTCIMFCMGPKECWWSFRCLAKFEVGELLRKERLCSWYLEVKSLSVCPMYAFPQSGQLSLYTLDCVSGSQWCVLCARRLCRVLLVRKATCMLECLNRSVMYLDSLPEYVNVEHFRSFSVVGGGGCLGVRWVWGGIEKKLLWRM